ncbi:MAG: OmpH family outer membrane protein [Hyphomonadaceae bacterium]|nr:OmpH family outer membrane protein [Hyphomonadaceae bacterium]
MRMIASFAAAALVAVAVFAAPEASAQRRGQQASNVVVINYERVVTESALGRDMTAKLQQVRTQVQAEAQTLAPEGQSIEAERQRLATATRSLTPDQIRNSSTWNPQFEALGQRVEAFQRRGAQLQGDFECTQLISLRDFDRQVSPVVRQVMEQRGAGVVLDARNIQMTLPEFDITTAVIQALDGNAATRTSTVARHGVAECQAQAPAAQQPPAQ